MNVLGNYEKCYLIVAHTQKGQGSMYHSFLYSAFFKNQATHALGPETGLTAAYLHEMCGLIKENDIKPISS